MQVVNPVVGLTLLILVGALVGSWAVLSDKLRTRHHVGTDATRKEQFFTASRLSSAPRSGLAVAANWIWAPALFVAAQQGYENGWVGVFWFTVPNVACLLLFAVFIHKARQRYPDGFTLSALIGEQYSPRVQRVYLVTLTGLATCAFAVQLLAGGLVVSTLTGLNFTIITVILSIVALSYSARLGMTAALSTKILNMGLIGLLGVGMSLAVVFVAGGDVVVAGLTGANGDMHSLTSGAGAGVFWAFGLSTTIGLMSGPFGDQSFWQIGWSTKAEDTRKAFIIGACVFALVPLAMSTLGFVAAASDLTVTDPQLTNLTSVLHYLPAWFAIPFLVYVLAGLISTLDSQLCSISSLVGHDFGTRYRLTERAQLRIARIAMVVLAVVALGIANIPGLQVVMLFIFYGTLRATTLIPTMMAVVRDRDRLNERGAFYGIITALVVGLPLSAVGNLGGITPLIVTASLTVIAVPAMALLVTPRSPSAPATTGERTTATVKE